MWLRTAAGVHPRLGCAVEVAGGGQQAPGLLAGGQYDVVFMDCRMPAMDGGAATAQLRRSEAGNRRTPVMAVALKKWGRGRA
jgi:two-component system, sensor histidine kinase and response regulator